MPPAWVVVDHDSYFGVAWAADCGPYTGPDLPDPPAWMPPEADELDYYIGVPNPSGAEQGFQDGSYTDGNVTDVYRFRSGPDEETGSDVQPIDAGSHLIIVFYPTGFPTDPGDLTTPPSKAPLALVAPGYVSGAHGPFYGLGHWSDWFDPIDLAFAVPGGTAEDTVLGSPDFHERADFFFGSFVSTTTEGAADAYLPALMHDALDDLRATGGTYEPGTDLIIGATVGRVRNTDSSFAVISAGFLGASYVGSDYVDRLDDQQVVPDDAGPIPSDQFNGHEVRLVQYESGVTTFLGWDDLDFATCRFYGRTTDTFDGGPQTQPDGSPYVGSPALVPFDDFPLVLALTDLKVMTEVEGTGFNDQTVSTFRTPILPNDLDVIGYPTLDARFTRVHAGPNLAPWTPPDDSSHDFNYTDAPTLTAPLSGVSLLDFALVITHRYYLDTDWPVGDLPVGPPQVNDSYTDEFSLSVIQEDTASDPDNPSDGAVFPIFGEPFDPARPTAHFLSPRWRYWVRGPIVFDAVYVIGGHSGQPKGGPPTMFKKSDGTWIPLVDGLAPPLL